MRARVEERGGDQLFDPPVVGQAPAKTVTWRRFLRDVDSDLGRLQRRRALAAHGRLAAVERSIAADDSPKSPGADATRSAHRLGLQVCGR